MVSIILKGRIMCMRKVVLNVGEKLFNVFFIVSLIVGPYSAIMSGRSIGGRAGLVTSISQSLMSIGATLTVALVVYSLLEIRHKLSKDNGWVTNTNSVCIALIIKKHLVFQGAFLLL